MINFIIILLLIFGFLMGLKRGLILQAIHLIGFIVAFIVAAIYYDVLASKLPLWIPYPDISNDGLWAELLQSMPLETAFYNVIAFAAIFFATKILLQIIGSMLDFVASLPVLNSVNKGLGAVLGFLEIYLIVFIVLYILALAPVPSVQAYVNDSTVALFILEHTPYLSGKVSELWFSYVNAIVN
ncbi:MULTISPECIES: CvpA family protein [unclassified Virgibacillus]|uniref:CvpA family protein n=1 Tax=unclassified Virgibacillus TaxID=2620237 RepID=UPI0024DEE442|nr:CvpA family protein [Virgibacillus sp. LDC-1]